MHITPRKAFRAVYTSRGSLLAGSVNDRLAAEMAELFKQPAFILKLT